VAHLGASRRIERLIALLQAVMKINSHPPQPAVHPLSSHPSPESSPAALRQAIVELFDEASHGDECQFCPHCGQPMKFVETTFYLYGTEAQWSVRLPVCSCEDKKVDDASLREISSINRSAS
jgi:hypothetical protein